MFYCSEIHVCLCLFVLALINHSCIFWQQPVFGQGNRDPGVVLSPCSFCLFSVHHGSVQHRRSWQQAVLQQMKHRYVCTISNWSANKKSLVKSLSLSSIIEKVQISFFFTCAVFTNILCMCNVNFCVCR